MKSLLIFTIILLSLNSKAQDEEVYLTPGIGFAPSLGYTYIEIENPNGSKANYKGFALQIEALVPLYQADEMALNFHLFYKNAFVDNINEEDGYSEEAKFYGPGAGLSFNYGKLGIGANYNLVTADHSATALYSQKTKYDFQTLSYYLDYAKHHDEFSFGARFSYETGDLEKNETGYSKDVGYTSYTGWIYFVYYTGFSLF